MLKERHEKKNEKRQDEGREKRGDCLAFNEKFYTFALRYERISNYNIETILT